MNWSFSHYSKTQVRRAGELLLAHLRGELEGDLLEDLDKYRQAYQVATDWRAAHAYPMQALLILLREKAFEVDTDATVVQRLKRFPSILSKLEREGMELDRMEDIAGCRAVMASIEDVNRVYDLLKHSRTSHKLKRERNYITQPKESGYRGIHMTYAYQGSKLAFVGLPVELQLRSKAQHAWATAVEVAGTFLKQSLKAGYGNEDWLAFFECAAEGFYSLETKRPFGRLQELTERSRALNAIELLQAFKVASNLIAQSTSKNAYYLFVLDIVNRKLRYTAYPAKRLTEALVDYDKFESEFKNDPSKDIVLISVDSVETLQKAYPNYFADTSGFIAILQQLLSLNTSKIPKR